MQMRLDLETISVAANQSSEIQMALQGQLMNSITGVDERIARVKDMLHTQANQIRESHLKQVGPSYNMSTIHRRSFQQEENPPLPLYSLKDSAFVLYLTLWPVDLDATALVTHNKRFLLLEY